MWETSGMGKRITERRGMMNKCEFCNGVTVKPDGINTLDPCSYTLKEIHRNVDVEIHQCQICGHVEIIWRRRKETEDEIIDKLGPQPEGE